MLPVAIVTFMLGLITAGYGPTQGGPGAYLFAFGFFVTSVIAALSHWRGHPAV